MPYVERKTVAGKTIEVERYFTARYGSKDVKRGENRKPTKEEQRIINTKQAEKKLRRLMNANFGPGDYHLILNYKHERGAPQRSAGEMKDDIARYLRILRKEYKAAGKEMKYIHVMEIGERGARHHHLVINKIDIDILQKNWPHARIFISPLDETGQYAKLASYFIKYSSRHLQDEDEEKLQGKRWSQSRNLIHPTSTVRVIRRSIAFRTEPRVPEKLKGKYYIDADSIEQGVNQITEYNGYGYFRFTLVQLC